MFYKTSHYLMYTTKTTPMFLLKKLPHVLKKKKKKKLPQVPKKKPTKKEPHCKHKMRMMKLVIIKDSYLL